MTGFVTYGFADSADVPHPYPASDWVNPANGIGEWKVKIKGTVGNAATGLLSPPRGDVNNPGVFTGNS